MDRGVVMGCVGGGEVLLAFRHRKGKSSLFPAAGGRKFKQLSETERFPGAWGGKGCPGLETPRRGFLQEGRHLPPQKRPPVPGGTGLNPRLQTGSGGAKPRGGARTLGAGSNPGLGKRKETPVGHPPHLPPNTPLPPPPRSLPSPRQTLASRKAAALRVCGPFLGVPLRKSSAVPSAPSAQKTKLPLRLGAAPRGGSSLPFPRTRWNQNGQIPPPVPGRTRRAERPPGSPAGAGGGGPQEKPSPRTAAPLHPPILASRGRVGGAGRAPAAIGKGKFAGPAGRLEAVGAPEG